MTVITRFSPSPTGDIHIGNVRTALINYLWTKKKEGKFLLRMDDTDPKRSKKEWTENIKEDLLWLSISWDEFYQQSDKLEFYNQKKKELVKIGKIYPCFETEKELSFKRKIQLSQKITPIYDRDSLKLSKEKQEEKIKQGIKPYYRFLLDDNVVSWEDGVKGMIFFKKRAFSDPVVFRADGSPTYTFCSVIDDIDYNITDVIRGEDHISNTAVQIQIFRSLTDKLPNFHHLSLLKTKESGISKRYGGFSVRELREQGIDPMAINSLLSRMGSSLNIDPCSSMQEVEKDFAMKNFSSSAVLYNTKDVFLLNRKILAKKSFFEAKKHFTDDITEEFWNSIRENIISYNDIKEWYDIFYKEIKTTINPEERAFIKIVADNLPEDISDFKLWIKDIIVKTGKKGRELYHPLRIALTGKEQGPELSKIVPLLGRHIILNRLKRNF